MKNGPAFTERFTSALSNLSLLSASLYLAPYVRDFVENVVSKTTGLPVSPMAQAAYSIAKEAIGYLGTPILLKAAAWGANQLSVFGWNKLKKQPQPQKDTHSVAPVVAEKDTQNLVAVPRLSATPMSVQERLDCLLSKRPQLQVMVEKNPACWTRLANFEQIEQNLTKLEALPEENLVALLTKISCLKSRS